MILISFLRYELWRFICPRMIRMMWNWRFLWLGWRATPRLLFLPDQADACCRYLLARLAHYAPSEVLRRHDGTSKWPELQRIIERHGIDTDLV